MRLVLALGVSVVLHVAVAVGAWLRPAPSQAPVVSTTADRIDRIEVEVLPLPRRGEGRGEGKATKAAGIGIGIGIVRAPVRGAGHRVPEPANDPDPDPDPGLLPQAPSLSPAAAPVPAPAGKTFDVTALHAALAASAQRCYPAAARRYHLTGEAQIDFCLDGSGALRSTHLASSTGQTLLDTAASDCVIAGALPLPAEASGGCYSVPVRFSAR